MNARLASLGTAALRVTRQAASDAVDVGAAAGRLGRLALQRGATSLAYDAAAGAVGVVVVLGIAVSLASSRA